MEFKERLDQILFEKRMTYAELARRLGKTRQGVHYLKKADSITLKTLRDLAKALDVDVKDLVS